LTASRPPFSHPSPFRPGRGGVRVLRHLRAALAASVAACLLTASPAGADEESPYAIAADRIATVERGSGSLLFGRLWNESDQPATATLSVGGEVRATVELAPMSRGEIETVVTAKSVRDFTQTTIAITGAYGEITHKGAAIRGLRVDGGGSGTFAECSTVSWHYDGDQQPRAARRTKKDVTQGLARISKATGLNFVETTDAAEAQIDFSWRRIKDKSVIAIGGWERTGDIYRGFVELSTTNRGMRDSAAGVERRSTIEHEMFHVLGIGHSDDRDSLMYDTYREGQQLTGLDRKVVDLIYSPRSCLVETSAA
jgi:hypothetical protein